MVDLETVREKEEIWNDLFISLACYQKTNFFVSTCPPSYSVLCTTIQYIFLSLTPGQISHAWPPFSSREKSKYLRLNYFASPRPLPLWSILFLLRLSVFLLTPTNFPLPLPNVECPCPIKILCSYTIHFCTQVFSFYHFATFCPFMVVIFTLQIWRAHAFTFFSYASKWWS